MMTRTNARLDDGRLYDVLSNERRRLCVRRIAERDPVAVQRLADELAEEFGDGAVEESLRRSVYISLVQTHLPKLDRYGVVDYDDEEKVVRAGAHLPEVASSLRERGRDSYRRLAVAVLLGNVTALLALIAAYGRVGPTSRAAVAVAVVLQAATVAVVLASQFGVCGLPGAVAR